MARRGLCRLPVTLVTNGRARPQRAQAWRGSSFPPSMQCVWTGPPCASASSQGLSEDEAVPFPVGGDNVDYMWTDSWLEIKNRRRSAPQFRGRLPEALGPNHPGTEAVPCAIYRRLLSPEPSVRDSQGEKGWVSLRCGFETSLCVLQAQQDLV